MKKILLLSAMASMVLMSCTKTEDVKVESNDAISFRTSINTATKGETTLATLDTFKVTAFEATKANYFTDLVVTSNDQGASWTTASTYYWPASGTLKFFAYAPATLTGVSIDKDGQKITALTPERNITKGKDVVVAYNEGTKAANAAAGVPLNFKHIYAQIQVKAKNSSDDYQVKVLGVKIANVKSSCDFTFPTTKTEKSYTIPTGNWANYGVAKAYGDFKQAASAKTLTKTYQSIMTGTDNFFVLPQSLTKWDGTASKTGNYIAVICQISRKNGASTYVQFFPPTADKYAGACAAIGSGQNTDVNQWEAGKRYVYNLEFFGANNGGAGKMDPDPTHNGNDNGNGDGNPGNNDPEGNNPDLDTTVGGEDNGGGDDIIGEAIKFTVTIDDWVDAGETEIKL